MKTQNLIIFLLLMMIAVPVKAQSPMQAMNKYAGDWKADLIMWMDPTQPPMNSQVTVHTEMIISGLFLTSHYTGGMMGMTYEALGTIGYDLAKKVYVCTWMDNMSSGINYTEGKASADGKSIEFNGTAFDAVAAKGIQVRQVLTMIDDTHQKFEIFTSLDGKESKTMEFSLTKQ